MTANTEPVLSEGMKIGGCYVLRKNLSKAGERALWLASDEVLGKDVTLHFVPGPVVADARAMTELRQEVKRNRQLIHPNILRVHDFVEDGNHVAISMDTFEGESLQDLLTKKGHLDAEDLKPWVAQLAETLSDAHRIQLFHRDLAPSNLYLRPNGGLLAANFGVSRVTLNSLERSGLVKGEDARIAYLSPQQIDGDRPGPSDDIYGFGVLMYTLLAGVPPFSGDDLVPQIRKTAPAPISEVRAAAGVTAPVPASWEKLIAGCLEKTPEARPRNLTDVLTLLGQESGPARPRNDAGTAGAKAGGSGAAQNVAGLDAPLKAGNHAESAGSGPDVDKPIVAAPAVEKAAPSGKPLHPEIPPIVPGAAMRKAPTKGALSANFPDLDRPRSKAPLVWLLLAAGIIGVGIYLKNKPDPADADENGAVARLDAPGKLESTPAPSKSPTGTGADPKSFDTLPEPLPVTPTQVVAKGQPGTTTEPPTSTATPAPKPPKAGALIGGDSALVAAATGVVPDTLAGASAGNGVKNPPQVKPLTPQDGSVPSTSAPVGKPPEKVATPTVQPAAPTPRPDPVVAKREPLPTLPAALPSLPSLVLPDSATLPQLEDVKRQREAAIEGIRKAAATAAAAQQEGTRRIAAAKAEKDKSQKELDAKRKTLAPVIQQAEVLEAERKKFEDEVLKAQAAAAEATKQAEAAKHKLDDVITKGGEKLKARQQAESELAAAASQLAGLGKEVEDLSQLLTKADTMREQARISQQQAEQDLQKISASAEQIRRVEMEAQRKASQDQIAAIEKQLPALNAQVARYDALLEQLKELGEAGQEASRKTEEKKSATQKQISELQAEMKRLSGGASMPVKGTGAEKVAPAAMAPDKPAAVAPETATVTNSLGMKFAPVGDVWFSIYLTRVKDFEVFATATGLKSEAWKNPGFKQGPDHPVVNVTWREAEAFCKWLTEKERKAGLLKSGETYRLPTDLEWSKAVGLPVETASNPESRDMGVQDVYPWGNQWPPPSGAGNYAGEETQTEIPIPNYNDGYPNTSPVGKFRVNASGLYDMGGNVWQWVADFWNGENRAKTLRGGSWYNGAIPLSLLSSCRISSSPDTLHDTYGFRIVRAADGAKTKHRN